MPISLPLQRESVLYIWRKLFFIKNIIFTTSKYHMSCNEIVLFFLHIHQIFWIMAPILSKQVLSLFTKIKWHFLYFLSLWLWPYFILQSLTLHTKKRIRSFHGLFKSILLQHIIFLWQKLTMPNLIVKFLITGICSCSLM